MRIVYADRKPTMLHSDGLCFNACEVHAPSTSAALDLATRINSNRSTKKVVSRPVLAGVRICPNAEQMKRAPSATCSPLATLVSSDMPFYLGSPCTSACHDEQNPLIIAYHAKANKSRVIVSLVTCRRPALDAKAHHTYLRCICVFPSPSPGGAIVQTRFCSVVPTCISNSTSQVGTSQVGTSTPPNMHETLFSGHFALPHLVLYRACYFQDMHVHLPGLHTSCERSQFHPSFLQPWPALCLFDDLAWSRTSPAHYLDIVYFSPRAPHRPA